MVYKIRLNYSIIYSDVSVRLRYVSECINIVIAINIPSSFFPSFLELMTPEYLETEV